MRLEPFVQIKLINIAQDSCVFVCVCVCVCKGCKLNARVLMATSTSYTMRGLGMCSESRR